MWVDLLHLSRNLRRSPASAGAAILTLALTLGASAAIFSVVQAVLLTPPPFSDPDAIVTVGETPIDEPAATPRSVSYATFQAWRDRVGSLAMLEALDATNLTLTDLGAAERVSVSDVTPEFLTLLGVKPLLGRTFEPKDIGNPVAVVSHAFWRGKLGSDRDVIGRQLVLGGQPHTIVGVLPESFVYELNPSDIWRPLPLMTAQAIRDGYRVSVVARLNRNVSSTTLTATLDEVSRRSFPPVRAKVIPVVAAIAGDATKTIALLGGASALALMIAFTNFAGLLIVRAIDRRRELAIRNALGASRSEIARQLLLEAEAVVAFGTVAGVLLAMWMTPTVAHLVLEQFGGVAQRQVTVNWSVIAVIVFIASACAALCAYVPAAMTSRWSVLDVLRRGTTPAPRELRARCVFVTAEVALAFVLLASVTLLGASLIRLLKANPGFDAHGVLALQVSVPAATYNSDRIVSFYSALLSALEERLGRRSSTFVNEIPLTGDRGRSLVGTTSTTGGHEVVLREAGPAYFDVMRIGIVAGRSFERRDNTLAPPRVILSRSLALKLFAAESPVGRQVWFAARRQMADVVGVVIDVKHRALDETVIPTVYLSALQAPSRSNIIVVRTSYPDADVIAAVREEVARLDGKIPVYRVRSMQDVVASSPGMPTRRLLTATFAGFALLAAALGAIGLFGVVAHDVASRRSELALRIALGADPIRILTATLSRGAAMIGWGVIVGAVLSIWTARAFVAAGFAANQIDALSIGLPALLSIMVGAAAILPAARRAAHTDPLMALRSE